MISHIQYAILYYHKNVYLEQQSAKNRNNLNICPSNLLCEFQIEQNIPQNFLCGLHYAQQFNDML